MEWGLIMAVLAGAWVGLVICMIYEVWTTEEDG